jgi:hypothetical protein
VTVGRLHGPANNVRYVSCLADSRLLAEADDVDVLVSGREARYCLQQFRPSPSPSGAGRDHGQVEAPEVETRAQSQAGRVPRSATP